MTIKIKTIIYCRVSSKEQADEGYSLDAQEKLLKEYAEKHNFEVVKAYRISESASGKQVRKSFLEMLEYANKHKTTVILCEKIDRLTRNLKDAATVDDWVRGDVKREVHFVKESFVLNGNTKAHENLVWDMKVAIARFYTNNLSEEVRKGQKEKLAQGWIPMRAKLGYKTIGEKGHKIHIIDEEKAPFVRRMFELYSSGNYSLKALVEVMYKEGLRNEAGNRVLKSRLHELLSEPFYYGGNQWNGKITAGGHEPLVSKELFDMVQAKLTRKVGSPQYKKHLPVFKAKIGCEECGGTVTWEIQKGNWYGHCNHYKACSQKGFTRQNLVEDQLFSYFEKVAPKNDRVLKWLEKALKEDQSEEIKYHTKPREELNRIVQSADKRIEGAYRDKLDGKMPATLCEKLMTESNQEKEDALQSLKKLNNNRTAYYEAGLAIHELALKAKDIYLGKKTLTEDKRLLLSYAFSNLSLKQGKVTPTYTYAFEFLAKWMPIVNKISNHQKTLLNTGLLENLSSNSEQSSAARTRTWNHLLNREPLYH